jgi:uncharacterized protein YodC (DUF2158 family)
MAEEKIIDPDKYWIKAGMCVAHKDMEGIRFYVEQVLVSANAEGRKFTKGVLCHWFNQYGGYEKGMFLTTELTKLSTN